MKKHLLIATAALAPAAASAGGFYVHEQSAAGLGKAYAGMSATGEDGSALWFNPASLAWADNQAYAGVSGVFADSTLSNDGASLTYPVPPAGLTVPVTGAAGEDPLQQTPIPYGGALYGVTDKLKLGFSVNAPFGLEVEYDDDFFGRYDSLKSSVLTLNLQGSVIYQATPTFAIAGGVDAQYIDAELTNALPNIPAGGQPRPDGLLRVEGDDWSYGFNAGAAWRPTERLKLGAHFRSSIEHELKGDAEFSGLLAPLDAQNGTFGAEAPVTLPGMANIGASYALTPEWSIQGQVNWFDWSKFTGLEINLDPTGQQLETEFNYDDSLSYSGGVEYAPDAIEGLTLRSGLMWDESPTTDGFRSTRVPDADRFWITGGASYELAGWKLDGGLAYVMLDDTEVNRSDSFYNGTPAQTGFNLQSSQEGDAIIASLGASYRF